MSVTQQQIISLLENVLFESTDQATANAATWAANPATTSLSSLALAMAASPEEAIAAQVVGYYFGALGRAPSAAEAQFYVSYAEKGLTAAQIAAGQVAPSTWHTIGTFFTASPEFQAHAGIDNSLGATAGLFEVVPFLYQSILGRAPSSADISFYDTQIASGGSISTLFQEFTASPEFHTDTAAAISTDLVTYGTAIASGSPAPTTIAATVTVGPPPPAPAPPAPATTRTSTFDLSGTITGATSLPSGETSLTVDTNNVTYTDGSLLSDSGNTITTLTLHETGSASTLRVSLSDSALTSVKVEGDIRLGSFGSHYFNLPSSVTLLDLTQDTDTSDSFYVATANTSGVTAKLGNTSTTLTLHGSADTVIAGNGNVNIEASNTGSGGSFTYGTGSYNFLELNSAHSGATVTVGADAAFNPASPHENLDISDPLVGLTINLGSQTGLTLDNAHHLGDHNNVLPALVAQISTAHQIEYGDDGYNTYIVESDNGTTAAGHVTVIELYGIATITTNGSHISLTGFINTN